MKPFLKNLVNYFFQGLLYVAPIGLTLYILYIIFQFLDDTTSLWTEDVFGRKIPGIGLLVFIVFVTLVGYAGKKLISKHLAEGINNFLSKIPVLKLIYNPIKDVISAFMGKEKKFRNPVLVKVSEESEIYRVGFLTQKDLSKFNMGTDMVAVFFPYSYAFMGELLFVPQKNVTLLKIPAAEALKFAVSGGLTEIQEKEKISKSDNGKETDNTDN